MKKIKPVATKLRTMKLHTMICILCFLMQLIGISPAAAATAAEDIFPPDSSTFSLKLRDTEIKDALRLMASQFNLNLIVSEAVQGKTSLDFDQVSFREAFDAILKTHKLGYVLEGNIIRVETLKTMREDDLAIADKAQKLEKLEKLSRKDEQERKEAEKLLAPLVTETVKLKYLLGKEVDKDSAVKGSANKDFVKALENLLSSRKDTGASIEVIEKTSTMVVTDLAENVDKIIKMAKQLDVPTPQIRIEVRIVEVSNANDLEFGIQWGGRYARGNNQLFQGANGYTNSGDSGLSGANVNESTTSPVPLVLNTPAAIGQGVGGILGMTFGKWDQGLRFLDVNLSALEQENKLEVISRPSIMVMQNQNAEIHVGKEVPMLQGLSTQSGGSGSQAVAEVEYKKIGIKLNITPQITSEDSIFMVVTVEKSSLLKRESTIQGQLYDAIETKNAFTQVVIKNGETLVIGGLYTSEKEKVRSGLPYLAKLPYIGCLFGRYVDNTEDKELMIFVTPEILQGTKTASLE